MKTSKETGSGIVVAVLLIVAVAALAGAGWAVYQHVKQSATTTNPTSKQNQTTNQNSGNTGNQQTQANMFRIPELGVELTLPDSLKDLQYVVDTTTVSGATFVRFTTATLVAQDGSGSACTAAQSALGVMWKITHNPAGTGAAATASKKVGNAYLLYNRPQQGCSNKPSTNQIQHNQAQLLEATVQTAQAL